MNQILKIHLSTLLLLTLPLIGHACGNKDSEICAAGSPWYDTNVVKLAISHAGADDITSYTMTIPDPLNLSIDLNATFGGKKQKGTVKLVEGRAMLMRGLTIEKGYEIDALDGPVLMLQMLVSLLTQAIPEGPLKFVDSKDINIRDEKRAIRIATSSASGYFPPPWTLTGSISRIDTESIDYNLEFTYSQKDISPKMLLQGRWQKLKHPPKVDSAMPLSGWKLFMLGPIEIKQEGGTILDYAAQSKPVTISTLGELQQSIITDKAKSHE